MPTSAILVLDSIEGTANKLAAQSLVAATAPENDGTARAEARGNYAAYKAIADQIAQKKQDGLTEQTTDEQAADLRQRTEIIRRSNRLRESCLKLSTVHLETASAIAFVVTRMPKEQAQSMEMLGGMLQQTGAVLLGFASAMTPEQFDEAERALADAISTCEEVKATCAAVLAAISGGNIQ